MGNIRSSIVFSFAEKYLSLVLSLIGTMVLSRLLTPADTGVYSVAAVWVGIAQVFRDLGVSQFIIQEKELTRDKIRAVYSVSFATSWSIALIILLTAPLAARFYAEPRLFDVLAVLAFNFAIIPFGSVTMAYMSRELKFRDISIINLFSSVVSLAVSVGLALGGYGVMSLAWATPVATLTTVLALVFFRPRDLPWLPGVRNYAGCCISSVLPAVPVLSTKSASRRRTSSSASSSACIRSVSTARHLARCVCFTAR